jgi:hypothetical protein
VSGFGQTTGDVTGASSVGIPWNFGNEDGSTAGSVTSELIDGKLVITVTGALSKSSTNSWARLTIYLYHLSFGFVVPNPGTPVLLQLTKVNSEFVGPVELDSLEIYLDPQYFAGEYSSQVLGGLASIGYFNGALPPLVDSVALPLNSLIPNDTVEIPNWEIAYRLRVTVDNSTGTFSETYTLRVVTPTPARKGKGPK